jgi:hypothetical protein
MAVAFTVDTLGLTSGQPIPLSWMRLVGLGLLALATLLYALTDAPPSRHIVHWIALVLIIGISLAFGAPPAIGGILQRLLWVVGFAWLVYLGTGEPGSVRND